MARSIAVAGKGGTGKSSIAALIIQHLKATGRTPILAIDSDPDANLGALLGIKPQKTLGDLRHETLEGLKNLPAGMTKANYFEAGMHGVVEETPGLDLITMGRKEGPGCYCYLNSLVRKFYEDLTPSYPWVVIDNEAGLEHISRGMISGVDALLTVVTPNPISFHTAEGVRALAANLKHKIPHQFVVANMVRPDAEPRVRNHLAGLCTEILCTIGMVPEIENALEQRGSLAGTRVPVLNDAIEQLIKTIGG